MELPARYFLLGINISDPNYLLELKLLPIGNDLQLAILIHQLKVKLTKSIISSITSNDSNIEYFNKLAKSLLKQWILSLKQSESLMINLYQRISNPSNDLIDFKLNPELKLLLDPQQLFGVYTFITQYVTNYLYYKTEVFKDNKPNPLISNLNKPQELNRPILSIVEKTKDIEETTEDSIINSTPQEEITFELLLSQVIEICQKNNILLYFLNKHINHYLRINKIEKEFDIYVENETLYLTIEPLILNEILLFSKNHYTDIIDIVRSIKIPNEELSQILLHCLNRLLFASKLYLDNKDKYRSEVHLIIKLYNMLFYIFALKYNSQVYSNNIIMNSDTFLDFAFNMANINQLYMNSALQSSLYQNSTVKHISITHPSKLTYEAQDIDKLKEIVNKHKSILDLQNPDLFISKVEEDWNNFKDEVIEKEVKFVYNSGKIINLSDYTNPNNNEIQDPLICYNLINSEYSSLQQRKLLSPEYEEILLLKLNSNRLDSSKLSIINKQFADIIINKILPNISSHYSELKQPISTLQLLQEHIIPFLPNQSSIQNEFKILYRIVIPFLYDYFNMNEFIDYFH